MTVTTIIAGGNVEYIERVPAAAFYPGHLLELTSSNTLQKHSTDGGSCIPVMVAIENDLEGEGVTDAYATTDRARAVIPAPGAKCYLKVKIGENIAIGDKLVSAGNGEVREAHGDSSAVVMEEDVVAIALEAIDLSSSSAGAAAHPYGFCLCMFK